MKLIYNAISHCGLVRQNNEDAILVGNMVLRDDADSFGFEIPDNGIIFPAIVCDGVGGNACGEVASMMACEDFKSFFENLEPGLDDDSLFQRIKNEFHRLNNKILKEGNDSGMASTLTGLVIYDNKAFILNAGDSRTYRLRYDNLKLLTNEHTEVRDGRRVITNCLGLPNAFIDISISAIVPDDTFIVCSDGLFDMIDEEEISANSSSAENLLKLALTAGGCDNTSIILIKFDNSLPSLD